VGFEGFAAIRDEVDQLHSLCSQCHVGQFPVDVELDIENTGFSPGVRRMQLWWAKRLPSTGIGNERCTTPQ
jgi:hypothetical protein